MIENKNTLLKEAQQYEKQEEFELAVEHYQKIIDADVNNHIPAHEGKARSLARLGHFVKAVEECHNTLKLNSELPQIYAVLGYISYKQQLYDVAEEAFLKARALDPDGIIGLKNLTSLYSNQKRYPDAIKTLAEYIQRQPDDLDMQIELAYLYLDDANWFQATSYLNTVFKIKPTKWRLYLAYYLIPLTYYEQSKLLKYGLPIGLYTAAIFAPISLGVLIGILPTVIVSFNIFIALLGNLNKGCNALLLLIAPIIPCMWYWLLILFRQQF